MPTLNDGYELLHRGSIALAQVEANGIRVDVDYCHKAIERLDRKIAHYEAQLLDTPECKEWRSKYGGAMSLGSNTQLGDILYNVLKFPITCYTDTGKPATNEEALKRMEEEFTAYSDGSDFLGLFFKVRKYEKAKSTYLVGTLNEVVDGFIHPNFGLHNVKSFRSSSQNPNIQNQCIRNKEIGPIVRRMFIPRAPDRHIVEIDFSAIEVRIGACSHKDPNMITYIKDSSRDMHRDAAVDVYMLPEEEVSKDARQAAKGNYVFSQFYGNWYPDCARLLWEACVRDNLKTVSGVPLQEHLASKGCLELGPCNKKDKPLPGTYEAHIMACEKKMWGERFPAYDKWRKELYNEYQRTGEFGSLIGFRYRGMFKRNEVINLGTQGGASCCMLWSLCEVQDAIRSHKMNTCIIGEVHDSIIADVPTNELDDYIGMACEIMTNKLRNNFDWIIVPIEVEVDVAPAGLSWYDKKKHSVFCSY